MTTAITRVEEVKSNLVKMSEAGQFPLPKHIAPERFLAVAQMVVMNNPGLVTNCDVPSLYKAVSDAAQDGLFPDGREGAIVPFKGKAKWMPMVAGICKKARNSGEISVIDAQVVYEKDHYEFWTDEKGPHFKHVKARGERGQVILTYAYALGKDGGCFFEEIDEEQMAAIEKKSNAGDSPWKGPFKDEMRRKSALRRLAKYRLPNSSDLDTLFKQDNEFYDDPEENKNDKKEATSPARLSNIIEAQAAVIPEQQAPSAQEAVDMAKKVFPGAREVNPKPAAATAQTVKPAPAAPAKSEPAKAQPAPLIVKGQIEKLTAKDGTGPNGPYRRYALRLTGAPDKWYGTFDQKIFDKAQTAVDSAAEVTVTYKERKDGQNVFRDITAFSFEEGEPQSTSVSEGEIPI